MTNHPDAAYAVTVVENHGQTSLSQLQEQSPFGLCCCTPFHIITAWNAAAVRMSGLREEDVLGKDLVELIKLYSADCDDLLAIINRDEDGTAIAEMNTMDGHRIIVQVTLTRQIDKQGHRVGYALWFADVTSIVMQARIDGLTTVAKRDEFYRVLAKQYARLAGGEITCLSLLFLDGDHFKAINDTYGHDVGDAVLKVIGGLLSTATRVSDALGRHRSSQPGRYGGEEFVLLLPDTDAEGAFALAERLRQEIEKTVIMSGAHTLHITVSIGIASHDAAYAPGYESLVKEADQATYQSKGNGRNRTTIHAAALASAH
ncbi:MAG: hypothetical protein RLZZ324_1002 [Candidatus Parcubacteria bacterium]|jgi:diguanylate cyclase (GGDEF)-like protein/PAS domain S-box-containing protein